MSILRAKDRTPSVVRYNSFFAVPFSTGTASGLVSGATSYAPLGLNAKFTHVAYTVMPGYTVGSGNLNVASGYLATGSIPTGKSSYGWLKLAGTYALNDSVTVTLAGISYPHSVTVRNVGSLQQLAASIAGAINGNQAASKLYVANSLGAEVVIQTLVYSTATPTFAVAVSSTSGTVTTSGANMIAGVAGTLPTQPPADSTGTPNPSTGLIQVPSIAAAAGNCLFPVDMILPLFTTGHAGETGTIYARKNYDAIFPGPSTLSAYTVAGAGSATVALAAYGVPVDNNPTKPQDSNGIFVPSQFIL